MKNLKKILALVIVASIITVMGLTAFTLSAATITIERDQSYEDASGSGHYFTWYRIFTADYEGNSNSGTFEGGHVSGTPNFDSGTSAKPVSYTATAAVAGKLGSWNATTNTWTPISDDVKCFVLYPIPGDVNGRFSVSWKEGETVTAESIQAVAAWLIEHEAYEAKATAPFTFNNSGTATTTVDTKGYYVIESRSDNSTTGSGTLSRNLIAITSDNVTIKEKNEYPGIDKEQEDSDGNSGTTVNVAVGEEIEYTVTIDVPSTSNGKITVYDTPSKGLEYTHSDSSITITAEPTAVTSGIKPEAYGDGWKATFESKPFQGCKLTFKFKMTVTAEAFEDNEKENTASLEYGSGSVYIPNPPIVKYKTYYGGLYKFDGGTEDPLSGTKFEVTVNGEAFNVIKTAEGYYIPSGTSNEVITNASGTVIIRGLDADKEYVFTETYALPGYNKLSGTVKIKSGTYMYLEESGSYETKLAAVASWAPVENNKGSILPSTGGIGTTIFYVVGAVLVIGTGVVLVTRRRMGNAD